ncbi:hypothetical protein D8674_023204 [Pyrus ussuriensis x Pyrus communis]|uniref:Uncharacterized protein n=1 Tax=Pyrus ussuriensis x Pyrus communis TaxID=2448454 RepID=A0A5N5GM33_9ROSA|nr:hypothetical protein D8674_023204 [Pyrus ussuriensis x Pyrus communis]
MASAFSRSVQGQTADYLKKRRKEKSTERPLDLKGPKCVASTMFRNGIRREGNPPSLDVLMCTKCLYILT